MRSVKRRLRPSALLPFRELFSQLLHLLGKVLYLGAVAFKNLRRRQLNCTHIPIQECTYLSTSYKHRLINLLGLMLLQRLSRLLKLAL